MEFARRAGVHAKVQAARLGHASAMLTLDVYDHLEKADKQDAIEAIQKLLSGKS